MTTIALAIPHTPWVPARVASMDRLRESLGIAEHDETEDDGCGGIEALENGLCAWPEPARAGLCHYREFTDRAPNTVWSEALWTWLLETGAEWCLQLQDDVMVAPCFWPALRAMIAALPQEAEVIGLTSVHPGSVEIARQGHRWFTTRGNLVGWAYMLTHDALSEFRIARDLLPPAFRQMNEDMQIAEWAARSGRLVWHPVPTIVDHDTSIPSSYANDHHGHRRPQVTWRDFGEGSLTDPSWWKPSGTPTMLGNAPMFACSWCGVEQGKMVSEQTQARIGPQCLHLLVGEAIRRSGM